MAIRNFFHSMINNEKRDKILTIPNIMSVCRLIMLPVIIILYAKNHYVAAGIILAVSAVTDVADGIVARKFNMISNLGKLLDPIADKLTQLSVLIALACRNTEIVPLTALFVVVQLLMGIAGVVTMRITSEVVSARWFGKVNTVLLEVSMIAVILFGISGNWLTAITSVCSVSVALCFVMYMFHYVEMVKTARNGGSGSDGEEE